MQTCRREEEPSDQQLGRQTLSRLIGWVACSCKTAKTAMTRLQQGQPLPWQCYNESQAPSSVLRTSFSSLLSRVYWTHASYLMASRHSQKAQSAILASTRGLLRSRRFSGLRPARAPLCQPERHPRVALADPYGRPLPPTVMLLAQEEQCCYRNNSTSHQTLLLSCVARWMDRAFLSCG